MFSDPQSYERRQSSLLGFKSGAVSAWAVYRSWPGMKRAYNAYSSALPHQSGLGAARRSLASSFSNFGRSAERGWNAGWGTRAGGGVEGNIARGLRAFGGGLRQVFGGGM